MKNAFEELPKSFYSFETNQPFHQCISCEKHLDENTDYVIEKAMRRYPGFQATDTIFDYAMCMDCAFQMRESLSIKSRKTMDDYFKPHFHKLALKMNSGQAQSVDEHLSTCLITGKNVNEVKEYQIYAFCRGNKINRSIPPYMVSESAIEEIMPLLSSETTDFLNGFFDKHFSPDPSMLEPIGPKLILV